MTKYLDPSFSVAYGSEDYRTGWDRIYGKKAEAKAEVEAVPSPPSEVRGFAVHETIMIGLVNSTSCAVCGTIYHFNGCDPGCPTCLKGTEP